MRIQTQILIVSWISTLVLTGCVSSKEKVFGTDMPTMVDIHDEKFNETNHDVLDFPVRDINEGSSNIETGIQWLPNPVMKMYVPQHLTDAGYPVPGYTTYFRFYTREHIAAPGEVEGWE